MVRRGIQPTVISWGDAAAVAAIIFVAASLQRIVAFGFALIAVPLLAFVVPTKSAVIILFLNGTITSSWLAVHLRRHIEWSTARRLGAGTAIGAPVGVVVLSELSPDSLRLVLGISTCCAAVWIIGSGRLTRGRPVTRGAAATVGVGMVSGILNTALATSGPPLVYELRRTGFEGDRFRATISSVFLVANLIGLPLLAAAGLVTSDDLVFAAVSVLPCVAGLVVGARISERLAPAHFVWAVDLLLLTTGLVTVVEALG